MSATPPSVSTDTAPPSGGRNSIGVQINTLFVVLVTVLLLVSGGLNYARTRAQLMDEYQGNARALQERLKISLVTPVWNLDLGLVNQILDAELKPPVVGIVIYDENDAILANRGSLAPPPGRAGFDRLNFPLLSAQAGVRQALGHVEVLLSRAGMQESLHAHLLQRLLEILLLDFVLIAALWYTLRVKLLQPLSALRNALLQAAEHHGPAEALTLPADRRDELGDLAHGFNRIAQRLADDAEAGRRAEAEVRSAYESLKLAQASLVQTEKLAALGGLVAGIAHEINTPLGIALTSASVLAQESRAFRKRLEEGPLRKSELEHYLRLTEESVALVLTNAERAAQLVTSFKQVAVDQTSEARREFDLSLYLDEVVDSLRPKFKRSGIHVVNHCPRGVRVDSYPGALAQIITNLVVNSVIHAYDEGQPGQITLTARQDGEWVTLQFADDGRGMSHEHSQRIFEPFFTTRRGAGGSGLGLHIVYNIVTQRLGGRIEVDSQPGRGTCFTMVLPVRAPEAVDIPLESF